MGLGEGESYAKCLVIGVISMILRGIKKCGGGFKVIILRGWEWKGGKLQRGDQFL